MQSNLLYQYEVFLPIIEHSQYLEKKSRLIEFTIGYPMAKVTTTPTIIYDNTVIELEDIPQKIVDYSSYQDEREVPFLTVKLMVDQRIPMEYINSIKHQIKRAASYKIAFATRLEHLPFENKLLPITYTGIYQYLKINDSIDFIEPLGPQPPPPPFEADFTCFSNQNYVHLSKNGIVTLNKKSVTAANLTEILIDRLREDQDYFIEYTYDTDLSLGQYLEIYYAIKESVYSLRDEMSMSKYAKPYEDLRAAEDSERKSLIKRSFPMKLVEPQSP
jgi:biopolymer transport protein ExbD